MELCHGAFGCDCGTACSCEQASGRGSASELSALRALRCVLLSVLLLSVFKVSVASVRGMFVTTDALANGGT